MSKEQLGSKHNSSCLQINRVLSRESGRGLVGEGLAIHRFHFLTNSDGIMAQALFLQPVQESRDGS